ncbi:hypothetical protein [Intrasporangium mesophilum]
MILLFRRSVRSMWSFLVIGLGLMLALLGVVALTASAEPGETKGAYGSGLVIGAGCVALGIAFTYGGARVGVFARGDGVMVRQAFGRGRTFGADEIAGFTTGEEAHQSMPLMLIYPVILSTEGFDVGVTSLASLRVVPGARRQVQSAILRMSEWTGKPVHPD